MTLPKWLSAAVLAHTAIALAAFFLLRGMTVGVIPWANEVSAFLAAIIYPLHEGYQLYIKKGEGYGLNAWRVPLAAVAIAYVAILLL